VEWGPIVVLASHGNVACPPPAAARSTATKSSYIEGGLRPLHYLSSAGLARHALKCYKSSKSVLGVRVADKPHHLDRHARWGARAIAPPTWAVVVGLRNGIAMPDPDEIRRTYEDHSLVGSRASSNVVRCFVVCGRDRFSSPGHSERCGVQPASRLATDSRLTGAMQLCLKRLCVQYPLGVLHCP
jgi:hypothetical protein